MAKSISSLWRRRVNRVAPLNAAATVSVPEEPSIGRGSDRPPKGGSGAKLSFAVVDSPIANATCSNGELHNSLLANRGNTTSTSVRPCPFWKRSMDIIGAGCALILLAPLFVATAVFIRCVSSGPILFSQTRFGLYGEPFTLWKFHTIKASESAAQHRSHVAGLMESDAPLTKLDRELPIIIGGRFLRNYGLDELPQLFNVLRGEMSLVGPRPDVLPLTSYQASQRERFNVLPGITGLWQVSGKNRTTFSEMIQLDLDYIRRRSIWFDLLIIVETIPAVVLG